MAGNLCLISSVVLFQNNNYLSTLKLCKRKKEKGKERKRKSKWIIKINDNHSYSIQYWVANVNFVSLVVKQKLSKNQVNHYHYYSHKVQIQFILFFTLQS